MPSDQNQQQENLEKIRKENLELKAELANKTHELEIEVALERVRTVAMSMNKPEDMLEICKVISQELTSLGVKEIRNVQTAIFNVGRGTYFNYEYYAKHDKTVFTETDYGNNSFHRAFADQMLKGAGEVFISTIPGNELKDWIAYQKTTNVFIDSFLETASSLTYHWYSLGPLALGISTYEILSDKEISVFKRFKNVFELAYTRFLDIQKAEAQAQEAKLEKQRSENLLLNILPLEIANELKQFGKSYARKYDQVTILFTDIKDFSIISETLSPEELVNQLDECFRAFDHIVDKHGLEKIKTIGDAYVCACGLPKPDPDNAVKTVRAAIDMLAFSKGFGMTKKIQDLPVFDFRFGIHTGPVVTGVVGLKKFTYDIWGDAVNMAARMEQHGEAGKINISGATYQLVKDKFTCIHRGKIEAKNKGMVDMYFVE